MSEAVLREMVEKVTKWGPQDELGTLSYIAPEKIARAAHLVTYPCRAIACRT